MPKVADPQRPRPRKRPAAAPTTAHQPTPGAAAPKAGNSWAVAGFILAFLFAPAGLIFSIIGLRKAKRLGGSGQQLASIGLSFSIIFMLFWAFMFFATFNGLRNAGKSQRDDARQHDIDLIVWAVNNYTFSQNDVPQTWSDIEGLVGDNLAYYINGTASINPANASAPAPAGNAAGVFPEGPATPTSGNSVVFNRDVVIVWQKAKCSGYNQVTVGDFGDLAILYGFEVDDIPLLCVEIKGQPAAS